MKVEQVKDFTNRIITASSSDLVVINYEMLMVEIDECLLFSELGDESKFIQAIDRARRLLDELIANLDFEQEISSELMQLYLFVNKKLLEAKRKKSVEPLDRLQDILGILLVGWRAAANSVESEDTSYENADAIYAGLTYGKGELNESVLGSVSRGLEA